MLFVKDFARMKDFYRDMLQAEPLKSEWPDSWAMFDLGGASLSLHKIPEEYARNINPSAASPRETNPIKLIFRVDDVAAERARLEGMGIRMLPRPWQNPAESCDAVDPEGNVFQIAAAM